MEDIDPERALAALTELQAEKERRIAAKVAAGTVINVQIPLCVIGVDTPEDVEENSAVIEQTKAAALARVQAEHGDCEVIPEFILVLTGVPSPEDSYLDRLGPDMSEEGDSNPWGSPPLDRELTGGETDPPAEDQPAFDNEEAASPVHVHIILRNGDDGDPGEIAEGMYTVEGGAVVLTDRDGRHITSRALLGKDPATLARQLLHETKKPSDFNRPIAYPRLGIV
jgi:hypothetical protein